MATEQIQNQTMGIYVIYVPSLGFGVAGLNIAPEIPVMTMSRHIIFGAVIGILLKSLFEIRK
ncbi:MAG: hypothetical protein GKS07_03410 [Nitrosopumilus sp.]|nr:MAG: hypothetical protein GKS07_03410 [Nitrosopumilus sp.]